MTSGVSATAIRESSDADWAAIEALYPAAFPDEDLLPLLRDLLPSKALALSLLAQRGGALVGHISFTDCGLEGGGRLALLAPLAVAPQAQRQGIGGALIEAGLARLSAEGFDAALVLGDPGYYSRFGFEFENAMKPPYPLPEAWREAWRSRILGPGPALSGALRLPEFWRQPALWGA